LSIVLPSKLEHFRHDDIVHLIKNLNTQYDLPNRGSWGDGIPDLEEPITRQVVEIAIARDLKTVWGQCVYYYRMGASHIHLVLSPRLFHNYIKNECSFTKENPVPNVEVYMLPDNKLPLVVAHKAKVKQTEGPKQKIPKHVPIWPFLASKAEKSKVKETVKSIAPLGCSMTNADDDVDTDLRVEPGFLSDPKLEIQTERSKPLCIDCKTGSRENETISCRKYAWIIVKELASKQRLCAF